MTQRLDYFHLATEGMKALGGVHSYVARSGLPGPLIDLVYLRVSQINGCAYCIDMHSRDLLKAGMEVDKLMLVQAWRESEALFSARERVAMKWAEAVTLIAGKGVSDALYQEATGHFSEKELADLTIAVGLMNAYNRIAISFHATPDAVKRRGLSD